METSLQAIADGLYNLHRSRQLSLAKLPRNGREGEKVKRRRHDVGAVFYFWARLFFTPRCLMWVAWITEYQVVAAKFQARRPVG